MILIACDSFKDSLPSLEVCKSIKRGLELAGCQEDITLFPLADGGEGTTEILTYHSQGHFHIITVNDPLFRPVEATLGFDKEKKTAFIEMANAAGLQMLTQSERTPMETTTFGVGEMILEAIRIGVKKIFLGIGGSATNDAGIGMAAALGYRFLDENEEELLPKGKNLIRIKRIDDTKLKFEKEKISIEVLCDVENSMFGENGAAFVYASQKGAESHEIKELDSGLRNFAEVLKNHHNVDFSTIKGGGAAGALGVGCMAFLNANLKPGINLILNYTNFEELLKKAKLVITGEGKIDHQTQHGKLITGITSKASKYNIPVIAVCGTLKATPQDLKKIGLASAFSILNEPCTLEYALKNTEKELEKTAFNLYKTLSLST
jgi:glycerate kinase